MLCEVREARRTRRETGPNRARFPSEANLGTDRAETVKFRLGVQERAGAFHCHLGARTLGPVHEVRRLEVSSITSPWDRDVVSTQVSLELCLDGEVQMR